MKIRKRLTYEKIGRVRFIGYLDMLRVIQRAMSRAHIDLAFSHGFNPHPQMSFSQPLSLGVTGIREYMELELNTPIEDQELIDRINEQLPPGLRVHECRDLPDGSKTAMALSHLAQYRIDLPEEYSEEYPSVLESFLQMDTIYIHKIAKSHGHKVDTDLNVRPLIEEMKMTGPHTMELWCVTNSSMSLKPDRMLQQFWICAGHPECAGREAICRLDLYHVKNNVKIPIMDLIGMDTESQE